MSSVFAALEAEYEELMARTVELEARKERSLRKERRLETDVNELRSILSQAILHSNQEVDFMELLKQAAEKRFKSPATGNSSS